MSALRLGLAFIAAAISVFATAAAPEPTTKACAFDGADAVKAAAKKGYAFSVKLSEGSATCQVEMEGEILVVSATSAADAVCTFSIFVPATGSSLPIVRVTLKHPSGVARYLQPSTTDQGGFTARLTAPRGQTQQYRVSEIEIVVTEGECETARLGDLL